ncbi:Uncaracterized surface protein containing fasciclin (FAS1) repeats [Alteromonadaceae bacterium Bs31]|nr:Uncaracterized surface protein containing fasciclin (FAS1) repeats [Alteromonadaceae bacterium Bs31]
MNNTNKLLMIAMLSLGLAACGGDDDDGPKPTAEPVVTTVYDVAADNASFTILTDLLDLTGLDAALDDESASYTVFAPTDAAFEALGTETLNALRSETDTLREILLYHVLGSEVDSAGAEAAVGQAVNSANTAMAPIAISKTGDDLLINLSKVVDADIDADNGIIHVIDKVMLPPTAKGEPTQNIVEIVVGSDDFDTLETAVVTASLVDALSDETKSYTVFAPTDAAFEALGMHRVSVILDDADTLNDLLLQHVVATEIDSVSAYAANGGQVETLEGVLLDVLISEGKLMIGGSTVVMTDIYATNGVIHVIDTVIAGDIDVPNSVVDVAKANGSFTVLAGLLEQTELDDVLNNLGEDFTVFAPTDAAFEALGEGALDGLTNEDISNILLYHVIRDAEIDSTGAKAAAGTAVSVANGDMIGISESGDDLLINTATVALADVMADNGVIHVIDQVLMPETDKGTPTQNIVEIVVGSDDFDTLETAVVTAGLAGTLGDEGETFTVFAPTDDAFAKIPAALLGAIIADVDTLSAILLQHVVSGVEADAVTAYTLNGTDLITADDAPIAVEIMDGALMVGGSKVVMTDIYATNGVIHVIDTVIVGDVTLPSVD